MTKAPDTKEIYSAHIPALRTLMNLGWIYKSAQQCLEMRGSNKNVILKQTLIDELKKRSFSYKGQDYPLSNNAIDQIVRDLSSPMMQEGLGSANEKLYHAMTLGITVTEFVDGKKYSPTIQIIDWKKPDNNSFIVTEEMEVLRTDGIQTRRPDIILYVNGLPLVVIEAKRPDSGNPNKSMLDEGISQNIRNQKTDEIPHLFAYAQLLFSISGTDGRYATTKTPKKFWAKWHEEEFTEAEFSEIKNKPLKENILKEIFEDKKSHIKSYFKSLWSKQQLPTDQDRLLISLLSQERLLEFIRYFLLFDRKTGKIATRYQQAFGIKALLKQISNIRPDGGREGGVIWHTTGSGKSFTMVFLCKALLLHDELSNCRVITITDRVDLEKQLAGTFLTGGALGIKGGSKKGEENKFKAATGKDLAHRIAFGNERIIFSIINKFATAAKLPECYNPSENIIVLVDEGHRSQGGETHERMKKALPNAAYIAFTGTPLLKDDKTTNKFGKIIHSYTMQRAVEDGTVTPLLYEERKPEVGINEKAIDNWFDKITMNLSEKQKSDLKGKYSKRGQIYGSENRIELIAWDIALHFKENFKDLGKNLKGQLATDSKLSAIRYKKALDSTGLVTSAVVISSPDTREGHKDVEEDKLPEVLEWWKNNVTDAKDYERQVIEDFGEAGKPDILIVVDKLLTGFDEPKNAVLYIDKPLKTHNLIQAIARVNRLHEEKKYGLLIDYRGVLKELDTALSDYKDLAEKTQGGFAIEDIDGLYQDISTEYKRLPTLHDNLWAIFADVQNKKDLEQYRQLLIPQYKQASSGEDMIDYNQKYREDFYESLTEFGMCLKTALSSRAFFEDTAISEQTIQIYKDDLRFFNNLRKIARQDAEETIDFSVYEDQIRKLVDKYVIGEEIKDSEGVYLVNDLGEKDPKEWSEEKLRNETDLIKSRLTKTIEQDLADDPYAQLHFSELLRLALEEADALFDHPFKQYSLFDDLEQKANKRDVSDIPDAIKNNQQAAAYYGLLKMNIEEGEADLYIEKALQIDDIVLSAIAENSLNPQNIEAEIRKTLLPVLFKWIGLDTAKKIVDDVIRITRINLSRGSSE